jgi:hypothetical protein
MFGRKSSQLWLQAPLLYKQAGLSPQAREPLQDLHSEKMFDEQANQQIPEETMEGCYVQ